MLDEPRSGPGSLWRVRGRVGALPVEFWMWPHLDAWTKLNVEPQRRVRTGRRYFRRGHRAIDGLAEALIREL